MLKGIKLTKSQGHQVEDAAKLLWHSFLNGSKAELHQAVQVLSQVDFAFLPKDQQQKNKQQALVTTANPSLRRRKICRVCSQIEDGIPQARFISCGRKIMLRLAQSSCFEFHCELVAVEHCTSQVEFDAQCRQEMRNFQKCLIGAFSSAAMTPVFFEHVADPRMGHALVQCVALPNSRFGQAFSYFKRQLTGINGQWAQNTRLISLDGSVNCLSKSIPRGFPYFAVDFALQSGLATALEVELQNQFGRLVVASCIGIDQFNVRMKQQVDFKKRKLQFSRVWAGNDWTELLQEEQIKIL